MRMKRGIGGKNLVEEVLKEPHEPQKQAPEELGEVLVRAHVGRVQLDHYHQGHRHEEKGTGGFGPSGPDEQAPLAVRPNRL